MTKKFSELDEVLIMAADDIVAIRVDADGTSKHIKKSNMGVGVATGNVTASANIADTAVVVGDGGVKNVKETGVLIDASDNVALPANAALDLIESTGAPATVAGRARVYSKDVAGDTRPFAMDDTGAEFDLTLGSTPQYVTDLFDLITLLPIDVEVTESGGSIVCTLTDDAGALFVSARFNGVTYTIVTPATVNLTAGTATVPVNNCVFLTEAAGVLTLGANTTDFPADSVHIAMILVQSSTEVAAHGPLGLHIYNDDPAEHIQHIGSRIRSDHASWKSGAQATLTIAGAAPNTVDIATTLGQAFQFHLHTLPVFNTAVSTSVHVVNDSVTPWKKVTDLAALLTDSAGVSMADRRFALVFFIIINQDTGESKLCVNLPGGTYNNDTDVQEDASKFANHSVPADLKGNAVLVAELQLRHQSSGGGTWTSVNDVDLRGSVPGASTGGSSASTEFDDSVFKINGSGDATKQLRFEVDGIATGTERTITVPDANVNLSNLVSSALNITDNFLVRGDGGAKGVQGATAASLDDSDNLSALNSVQVAAGSVGAVGVRVGSATIGLFRPAANQLGLGANNEAVIVDNDGATPSLRPDVTGTWALGEEALAWLDVNANAFSQITAGVVGYTLNVNGWQYTAGLGTLLIGQLTPGAGATATAFQLLGGQAGAASGAAGKVGGATTIAGGIGGAGDGTYAPGVGGALSLVGGAAGTEGVESVVLGGDVDIDPGAGTGVTENGNVSIGMATTPVLIESGACPWDHGGSFTFVPEQQTESTASLTLDIFDDGSEIYCTHASNINVTLNTITGGAGVRVKLIPTHATGTITIVAGTATVRKQASFTLVSAEQYAAIYVYFKGDSEAYVEGGLALA